MYLVITFRPDAVEQESMFTCTADSIDEMVHDFINQQLRNCGGALVEELFDVHLDELPSLQKKHKLWKLWHHYNQETDVAKNTVGCEIIDISDSVFPHVVKWEKPSEVPNMPWVEKR